MSPTWRLSASAASKDAGVVKRPSADAASPVVEITIRDVLWEKLRRAKNGLRRNSIDELEALVAFLRYFPRDDWPPELDAFVRRRFERAPDSRLVFKRPRHRMKSRRRAFARWFHDPNHIAAHFAAQEIARMRGTIGKRSKRRGSYKLADGMSITEVAIRRGVDRYNANPGYRSGKLVNIDVVKTLVRRGRTKRPRG